MDKKAGDVQKKLFYVLISLATPSKGASTMESTDMSVSFSGLSSEQSYEKHQRLCHGTDTVSYKFHIPDLIVGTLDNLMKTSDEVAKLDTSMEQLCRKVVQTMTEVLDQPNPVWTIGSGKEGAKDVTSIDDYLKDWHWDEKKYPYKKDPLKTILGRIQTQNSKFESDLRTRSTNYSTLARTLAAEARKDSGSLATRSLNEIVKASDIVETEYLTTLFIVVPKHMSKEWLASYETMVDFVLPKSSKLIHEDSESALFTVTLFKRMADDFKNAAREKRYTVREVKKADLTEEAKTARASRADEKKVLESKLIRWCRINFGEIFAAWMHVKAVRIFVESVLRYGLPPKFISPIVRYDSPKKDTKKLLPALGRVYGMQEQKGKKEEDAGIIIPGAAQEKYYPFVYTVLELDLVKV